MAKLTTRTARKYLNFRLGQSNMSTNQRTFDDAIERLNSLQSNAKVLEMLRNRGKVPNDQSMIEMKEYLNRIGYQTSDLNRLNVIHVAGTKGKGSTCAFTSSILLEIQKKYPDIAPKCIGMYTSPHLRSVCERIQLNGKPVSKELFTKYFFQMWDRLEATASESSNPEKPMYFRFLTLLAWHIFLSEGVDAAIIEVGIGGEYDSTNLIEQPIATAVTSLGLDHTALLGSSIAEIAWQKAGIYKSSATALTCNQVPEALPVLEQRANERHTSLRVIKAPLELKEEMIGLSGAHQLSNAALAIAMVGEYIHKTGHSGPANLLKDPCVLNGLRDVKWPGRCQLETIHGIQWCFDGAHTQESLEATGAWLASRRQHFQDAKARVLVFNQQSRDDPIALIQAFLKGYESSGKDIPFTHAIFSTNITWKNATYNPELLSVNTVTDNRPALHVQEALATWWNKNRSSLNDTTKVAPTVEEAIEMVHNIKEESQSTFVCVTGSLHLTGGVFVVLDKAAFE
ncbi:folylpolyglutamate synthase [Schizosaccharomyces cryophilus OY26]|uniref:Folylpolyglutamate synthase n=1 Tax=Schizosaccharomyces cryophilus (strain OY26 / ATCC MYA-4695 / CBS 11777 / NBRC 106824 / NRRL Y48691) TaxID=653667 RepID=S9VTC9_SCHCR|nr:folylpolyglutamate synthase [Schizosaccharomyces cryophilus OY26]EPY49379.1 folylpolyglutamate synthase [Schizosaccharomyces cryophilus OY26]